MRAFRAWTLACVASAGLVTGAGANPIVARDADAMNARPKEWLAHPTGETGSELIRQFSSYGISRGLLSPATMDLLEREFDRFAPLLVQSQEPPFQVQLSLQRWYREHADRAQAEAMKRALRAWLDSDVTPRGSRGWTDPGARDRLVLQNRNATIEALGDWQDRPSLVRLRQLRSDAQLAPDILAASIRRIEDPDHADPFAPDRKGRVAPRRALAELDSIAVVSYDAVTHDVSVWQADPAARGRLWTALQHGRLVDSTTPYREAPSSAFAGRIDLSFHDGRSIELERAGMRWRLTDHGRLDSEWELTNDELAGQVLVELTRAGIVPPAPRFVAESVTLSIVRGELSVHGVYRFEGATPGGFLPLAYPFPEDSTLGTPRLTRAVLTSSAVRDAQLPVDAETGALPWRFGLHPGAVAEYELSVEYRQPLAGTSATYVLRSTKEWERPLRDCWYQVIMDSSLGEPRFEYPFKEVSERPGFRRFLFEPKAFMPERNLVVRW